MYSRLVVAYLAGALVLLAHTPVSAQADKSGYSLFSPTPRDSMREMSTDRPDQTESPYTVDAGHVQFELDLWNHAIDRERDGGSDARTTQTAIAPINVKIGLTNAVDLQIVAETYIRSLTRDMKTGAVVDKRHGFGDITTRLKINLWGNDGGGAALAIMPFVKIPTNAAGLGNKSVEGGLIVPYAFDIVPGVGVGLMTEVDAVRNGADTGYTAAFVNTATIGFDLAERIGMYTEIATTKTAERGSPWEVSFDAGLTYALTDNVQFDLGVNVGLTRAATDLNPFVGLSWRF